ncbi:MAG: VWA domain-containing protein [Muribaculaceae bacterium]|nr:VWA domain-containing protein [Muribaculaceae bacterium]
MKKFQGKRLQKRWLGLLLTAAMLTGALGGCGKAESDSAPAVDNAVKGGTSGNTGAASDAGENFYEDAGESSYDDVETESGQYTDDVVSSADMDDAYNSSADVVSGGFARAEEKSMEYTPYDEYPLPEEYYVSPPDTEEYNALEELGFMAASVNPLSTFSADVDTASYSNLRRMIEDGYGLEDIPEGAVRIEELLNYFHYDYAKPKKGEPFGVTTQIADCPWNANTKIAMIGLKTQDIDFSEAPASNLVFLLDVSGSMYSEDKLPLLQKSFSMLTENLTAKDRVSIVTYAGEDRVILEGVQGTEQKEIIDALDALEAGGSTAGSAGITTAYGIAEKYFIKGGNNRIILATDGDLNVGLTTEEELEMLISEKKESGVYLSVLGFGTGNIKDNKMEILADKGNGNYAYIDSLSEAKKVLVEELGATFVTVAEDVKFQVEFNPDVIAGYRLIGYENRQLAEQDFADDTKDAGEIGAGHSVTVLYEIVTTDAATTYAGTSLKYADKKKLPDEEWFTVNIRYKKPNTSKSLLSSYPVDKADYKKEASQDMQFAMAVAEFGLVVNDSSYKGDATMRTVIDRLKEIDTKSDEYKDEFCYLVRRLEKN